MKCVIFDLDGTILDTLDDLMNSTNYVLKKYDMPLRSREEIRQFVGNGIGMLVHRAVSDEMNYEVILADFKEYYGKHCADKTRPYEGMIDLLTKLKERGILLAVVSNKADFAVGKLVEQYFPGTFDIAVGQRENIRQKPCPDSVNEVIRFFNVSKEEAVYIGDSEVDIQTAKNAEMKSIIVTWGFRDEAFLKQWGATKFAHDVSELEEMLVQ